MKVDICLKDLIEKYPRLKPCAQDINNAVDIIQHCLSNGGKLLLCGNGGSASDCDHIAAELIKSMDRKGALSKGIKDIFEINGECALLEGLSNGYSAISLCSNTSAITAIANDCGYDNVFAQQVVALGKNCDVIFALSTSGESLSIIKALHVGKMMGLKTILMTSENYKQVLGYVDIVIRVPSTSTPSIQELHLPVYHYICETLQRILFGEIT